MGGNVLGFEVLAYGIFPPETIVVEYLPDRRLRWEGRAQTYIQDVWDAYARPRRDRGIDVYNGNVLRLDSFAHENGTLRLELSDVDFRTYVGTALPGFAAAFPAAPRANPLAVCIALATSDAKIVIEKRKHIDAYRGRYHVIGGFMEKEADAASGKPDPHEAIRREVAEELGIVLEATPQATGLIRTPMGSELCFSSRLPMSFGRLVETKTIAKIDAEIGDLMEIPDSPAGILSFLLDHDPEVVSSGRACLLLHGREAHGRDWYEEAMTRLSE
jgi:8-oxo-dGTP pyrophosphatase MutT (NUDIX family)